jgi:hypothetical protein
MVGHRPLGNDGPGQTVQVKLDYGGMFFPEYGYPKDGILEHYLSYYRACNYLSNNRTSPPGVKPFWGFGQVTAPKGMYHSSNGFDHPAGVFGFRVEGHGVYATTFTTDSPTGHGFKFGPYVGLTLKEFYLYNKANGGVPAEDDTSVGILLESKGGGAQLIIEQVAINGYHTSIRQKQTNTTDGDKTLVIGTAFGGNYGYDQGINKQAIGWTFLNSYSGSKIAHFKLGGAGQTLIMNHTSDVSNSLFELPDGSGNPGDFPTTFFGQAVTMLATKLEYHGNLWDHRRLVDARASTSAAGSGGSAAVLTFRDVHLASGATAPTAPDDNIVMEVGANGNGSTGIRVQQDGGWIEGTIKVNSQEGTENKRRWAFRHAVRAPLPEKVQFLGSGSHCLMEWRACESVRVDQYRGGQSAQVSIDSRKALLMPLQGKYLIDTRQDHKEFGDRRGRDFKVVLPNLARPAGQVGGTGFATFSLFALYVQVENPYGTHSSDVQVTQFANGLFTTPVGLPKTVGGGERGLFLVNAFAPEPLNILNGEIYVRVTKPGEGQFTEGRLVLEYFPYFGA